MLNNFILVGRLVSDPQINETITLAVNRSYKNEEGAYDTDFIPVILQNTLAAQTSEYCRKGDLIGIKGRIETRMNLDCIKETVLIADRVTFLSQTTNTNDNLSKGEI